MWETSFLSLVFSSRFPIKINTARTTGSILKLHGVGFKSFCHNGVTAFQLGYSHFLVRRLPRGANARTHKQVVAVFAPRGNFTYQIQQLRVPNPFTSRGVYLLHRPPTTKEGKKR